jgi:hypothetical protein
MLRQRDGMRFLSDLIRRKPLLMLAVFLAVIKCIQLAIDSTPLFFYDSSSFMHNALRLDFLPERSYVYGALIRVFAVSFRSLRAIVTMQVVMGWLTAWLLAFMLVRFLKVRAWIAMAAASVFAFDPVQVIYEHMTMAETTTLLAMACFLLVALQYLRTRHLSWLVILAFIGAVLVSLRIVYVPIVLTSAALLPLAGYLSSPASAMRGRTLAVAFAVSCGSMMLLQLGYRHATGYLAGREPAYHYQTGFFLVASVAPIVDLGDSEDARVSEAIAEQNKTKVPLPDFAERPNHLWIPEGFVARLKSAFPGDERAANEAAGRLARAAILHSPFGFLKLGLQTYASYWKQIPHLPWYLHRDDGSTPESELPRHDFDEIRAAFGDDVSHQHLLQTPSRQYHIFARDWYVFLLTAPFLGGLAFWLSPANQKAPAALLLVWSWLLLAATCVGAVESEYRYLHPFSFTGVVALAVLVEMAFRTRSSDGESTQQSRGKKERFTLGDHRLDMASAR